MGALGARLAEDHSEWQIEWQAVLAFCQVSTLTCKDAMPQSEMVRTRSALYFEINSDPKCRFRRTGRVLGDDPGASAAAAGEAPGEPRVESVSQGVEVSPQGANLVFDRDHAGLVDPAAKAPRLVTARLP
jgi:hypothetical protein